MSCSRAVASTIGLNDDPAGGPNRRRRAPSARLTSDAVEVLAADHGDDPADVVDADQRAGGVGRLVEEAVDRLVGLPAADAWSSEV